MGNAAVSRDVGGLFMAGLPGLELDDSTLELIRDAGVNNFIIFKRNVADPDQLRTLCADVRRACIEQGLGPPLIAIDQEGGSVTRLPPPFTQFDDARVYAESADPEAAVRAYADSCAAELARIGINMNLAPVLDVCPAGEGYFMERRSLGEDPDKVARLGRVVITALQQAGVAACGKHFPGLGGAVLDPHEQLPTVLRSREAINRVDLAPFREAARAGVAAIMTSHTVYSELDPGVAATLSPVILTGLLREELGYDGVIVTDDLEMGAIENEGPLHDAAVLAFQAGADLLLICHEHDKVRRAMNALADAVAAGRVEPGRIEKSLGRLAAVRKRFADSGS